MTSVSFDLWPSQKIALDFLVTHARAVLADPPGTGKTPIAARALAAVNAQRVLAVVPKAVISHWQDVLGDWHPDMLVVDGRGTAKQRALARQAVEGHRRPGDRPTLLLVNYEALRQDKVELARMTFDTLLCDESHRLKTRSAQQTRAAGLIARRTVRCWLLTGTPLLNAPQELWSQLNLLDHQRWSSYWRWVGQHMVTQPARWPGASQWATTIVGLRPGAGPAIRRELADVLIQRPLEQLLPDLPPVTMTRLTLDLDAEERRLYDEIRRKHWTILEDGTVVATVNEVSRITRYRQLVSNLDALGAAREKPGTKISATVELVADLAPEQVVVLAWSHAAAERVARETGGVFIHGGVSTRDRVAALDAFKTGQARIISGTYGVLGEGVDGLQVARHLILIDRPWRPADEEQAIGRLRRSGQASPVSVTVLLARNTIDRTISDMLDRKQNVIDAITGGTLLP